MEFGHALKLKEFLLDPNFCNLNHGSFGATPRNIKEKQNILSLEQEKHPDRWFRVTYYKYIEESRCRISKVINARESDVVLVENASSGINSILRSIPFQRGDKILFLSTAYAMVVETLNWLSTVYGVDLICVDVELPLNDQTHLLASVSNTLQMHPDLKFCIFSHISSMPSMIEPVKDLVTLVRKHTLDAQVIIDGAHAPGQVFIDIDAIGADYYVGNCHKWLYTPKGVGFLWVAPGKQTVDSPEPTVISSSKLHDFVGRFAYTGTRDYTAFAVLPQALEFIESLGGFSAISAYCMQLASEAASILTLAWGTSLLIPLQYSGYMINVILPSENPDAIAYLQRQLDEEYNIYIVYSSINIKATETFHTQLSDSDKNNQITSVIDSSPLSKSIYITRLSMQIYLETSDFLKLADLVPFILKEFDPKIHI